MKSIDKFIGAMLGIAVVSIVVYLAITFNSWSPVARGDIFWLVDIRFLIGAMFGAVLGASLIALLIADYPLPLFRELIDADREYSEAWFNYNGGDSTKLDEARHRRAKAMRALRWFK